MHRGKFILMLPYQVSFSRSKSRPSLLCTVGHHTHIPREYDAGSTPRLIMPYSLDRRDMACINTRSGIHRAA
jgi:hypothetical protein